jgi:hypothetical protein
VSLVVCVTVQQADSEEVARLKLIIKRLQSGQPVSDLTAVAEDPVIEDALPPDEDDGKVYDGY